MRFITDETAASIPALQGLDDTERSELLLDADRVYRYVGQHEWITEEDLRIYGERNGLPPIRLNAVLSLLGSTGKLVGLDSANLPPAPEPEPEPPAPTLLEDLTLDDLREKAADLDVQGRSSLKKAELVEAIRKAEESRA